MKAHKQNFIILVFITCVVLNGISNCNINADISLNKDNQERTLLKTGNNGISIITPEVQTYTEPMKGYYLGTHGFEDEKIGNNAIDIDFINYHAIRYKETPAQWADFSFSPYGEGESIGNLEDKDGDYIGVGAGVIQGSSSSVYSDPINDVQYYGWTTAPLYNKIEDGVRQPSTSGFTDGVITGSYGDFFYVDMSTVSIPAGNYITQVSIWCYTRTDETEYFNVLACQYRFNGYTGWSSQQWIGQYGWAWDSVSWSGLFSGHYGDAAADSLQIRFEVIRVMSDTNDWDIECAYAQIYYAPATYDLDFTVDSAQLLLSRPSSKVKYGRGRSLTFTLTVAFFDEAVYSSFSSQSCVTTPSSLNLYCSSSP